MSEMSPDWLTVEEIAEELRVSPVTIRRYCASGRLPAVKLGKAYRIRRSDYETWLKSRETHRPDPGR